MESIVEKLRVEELAWAWLVVFVSGFEVEFPEQRQMQQLADRKMSNNRQTLRLLEASYALAVVEA